MTEKFCINCGIKNKGNTQIVRKANIDFLVTCKTCGLEAAVLIIKEPKLDEVEAVEVFNKTPLSGLEKSGRRNSKRTKYS